MSGNRPSCPNSNSQAPDSTSAPGISGSAVRSLKITEWMRWPAKPEPVPAKTPNIRSRRDSSTLSADEALNISRANATGNKPETTFDTIEENSAISRSSGVPIPVRQRSNSSKYNSLGLITAFSGGPGSF